MKAILSLCVLFVTSFAIADPTTSGEAGFVSSKVPVASSIEQPPADIKRGSYKIDLTAGDLFSEERAREYADTISSDYRIVWEVYVPENYDPEKPAGVMTYVSPTRRGEIPEKWKQVMADRNLIWIGANRSGNIQNGRLRIIFAVLGTELMRQTYNTDSNRIYISGFSGGGRISSWVVKEYPSVYRGAVFYCGVNYYEPSPESLELMKHNRYVYLTGTNDFNLSDTRAAYNKYKKLGLTKIRYMSVPRMGHRLPPFEDLDIALAFLDGDEANHGTERDGGKIDPDAVTTDSEAAIQ